MLMSDLPQDLVEEILSRVPAKSVKRLRSTCKRWNAIFKDQRFTEKHFSKAPKESMVLMLNGFRVCPVSVNLNVAPPATEFKDALGLKDSNSSLEEEVDIFEVFHCDGLLLCNTRDSRLVVWNPCLGETTCVQGKTVYKLNSRFTLGYIQNSKTCRSYKILRRWGFTHDKKFEIYEFSSDSWRVLNDVGFERTIHIQENGYSSGASSLKGNTFWVATDTKEHNELILCFDFTEDRFKRLCLPPFENHGGVTLSVGREEQLSARNRSNDRSKIEMWVTNKKIDIESELLWSKSYIVDVPIFGYASGIFTSLLIDAEKKVSLCCCIGIVSLGNFVKLYTVGEDNEYYTETPTQCWVYRHAYSQPVIFNYVQSLFQVK